MATWAVAEGRLVDGLPMRIYLAAHEDALWSASMHDDAHPLSEDEFLWRLGTQLSWRRETRNVSGALGSAVEQIREYFAGRRRSFDLPLSLRGTAFQVRVWKQLIRIPFGATRSYGEIAESIGKPDAPRAVGS